MALSTMQSWLGGFALDLRLAVRILVRYPLLTIVGSVGMAAGVAAGVAGFEIRTQAVDARLPLDEGHRIVGIRNRDLRGDRLVPIEETDFRAWLDRLQRFDDLGAVALAERNLFVNGNVEPIAVAEMTASGFRIARVQPLLGRVIAERDEAPGAPPIAVIGYALWQRTFLGDPNIIGRSVRLGSEQTTIVGVMPQDFGFPVSHQVWTALRRGTAGTGSDAAPLLVFGRLAPGVTIDGAQAELTTVGQRMAADAPATHAFLRPEAVPYTRLIVDSPDLEFGTALANIFLAMLASVVFANVALLMFARAASRESEIGVRHALGASRGRIVAQLFVEAVVLSGLSIVVGLAAAQYGVGSFLRAVEADSGGPLPFWLNDTLAPSTIAYGAGLMMLGAVIIGVLPALKVTRRGLQERLRQSASGSYRFGGAWTTVIAAQVAVTVMFPAGAFFFHRWVVQGQTRDVGLRAEQYLSARLATDSTNAIEELRRQLTAEPGVTAVAVADRLPGMQHAVARFEVEGDDAPPAAGYRTAVASVDADFFAAMGAPVLAGRGFTLTDLVSPGEVAIVNTSFVERVVRGRNPVGRRIRRASLGSEQSPGPWIEIVGVVRDLGIIGSDGIGMYRPLAPGSSTVHVAIHVAGAPESLAGRLRTIASDADPTLRVYDVRPLNQVGADLWLESQYMSRLLTALSGIALLLSLMAIYSVMAFTVVQRTREIGTRVALGADRRRLVSAIVRRPLAQVALGIGAGIVLVALVFLGMFQSAPTALEAGMIAAYATLMLGVCLSACIVPLSRALRLQPSQVLRADG